jgi:alanyl-tRNA synthetase
VAQIVDIKEIVPQIPGESDASYTRFILYLKKGFHTLREYADYLQTQTDIPPVTYNTIETNSHKDKWTARKKKYQEIKDQEIQEELEQLFKDLNTRGIHDMATFLDELQEVKDKEIELFRKGKKPSSVMFTLRKYIQCYREATEIYYINSRHKLEPDTNTSNTKNTDEKLLKIRNTMYGEQP